MHTCTYNSDNYDEDSEASVDNPYTMDAAPSDIKYECNMVNGVMRVYTDNSKLEQNDPIKYYSPDLNEFLQDQNILMTIIADGPLLVDCN